VGRPGGEPRAWDAIEELIKQALTNNAPIALDSSILIAYLADEAPIAGLVAPCLEHVEIEMVISTITLAEALVRPARGSATSDLDLIVSSIAALPNLRIVAFDHDHAVEAAIVRAETRLKLPDSAIVATARLAHAVALIGNDGAWIGRPLGTPYVHMDDLLGSIRMSTGDPD
jgi:predicted nucleic acid-binding protein